MKVTQEVTRKPKTKASSGHIYIGVGGWTFEPWRGVFYPEKLAQAKELSYAASKLTSIEPLSAFGNDMGYADWTILTSYSSLEL